MSGFTSLNNSPHLFFFQRFKKFWSCPHWQLLEKETVWHNSCRGSCKSKYRNNNCCLSYCKEGLYLCHNNCAVDTNWLKYSSKGVLDLTPVWLTIILPKPIREPLTASTLTYHTHTCQNTVFLHTLSQCRCNPVITPKSEGSKLREWREQ